MDSSTTQQWSKFLPSTQWRFIRHSLYGLQGEHIRTEPKGAKGFDAYRTAKEACPTRNFSFFDYDGEKLTARTNIEERERRFGEGWFKGSVAKFGFTRSL